jgi:ankyrin repeat protein
MASGGSALVLAATQGDWRAVMAIVRVEGPGSLLRANSRDEYPLHKAVQHEHEDVALRILELLADQPRSRLSVHINEEAVRRSGNNETLLVQAIRKRMVRLAFRLLDVGANARKRDLGGNTPLMHAVKADLVDVARRILNHAVGRATVNTRNEEKRSPLLGAVERRNMEMARWEFWGRNCRHSAHNAIVPGCC